MIRSVTATVVVAAMAVALPGLAERSAAARDMSATFSNDAPIALSGIDSGNPYPSPIAVSGLEGDITSVQVALEDIDHTFPDRVQAVLVAPNGDALELMDRAGGHEDVVDLDLTFADSAPDHIPDATVVTGTYKPTNWYTGTHPLLPPGPASFAQPGPANGGTATLSSVFGGDDPNGTWQLFVRSWGDSGSIGGGWSLTVTTDGTPPSVTPNTTFTKTPARKVFTTVNAKKVTFAFTSSVAGSTFRCQVDRKQSTACSSPFAFKAKVGRHTVEVRATRAGETDPTPATFTFVVKKKPKG